MPSSSAQFEISFTFGDRIQAQPGSSSGYFTHGGRPKVQDHSGD
jgi:hypothetical protein